MRALELLERLGTGGARAFTRELAEGEPDSWVTDEAKGMLGRMGGAVMRLLCLALVTWSGCHPAEGHGADLAWHGNLPFLANRGVRHRNYRKHLVAAAPL